MLSPMLRLQEGKNYLAAMSCAANYAWVNRSSMTFLVRQAFQKMFKQQADDLDMHVVYDVSHNIAKVCVWSSDPFVSAPLVCCVACHASMKEVVGCRALHVMQAALHSAAWNVETERTPTSILPCLIADLPQDCLCACRWSSILWTGRRRRFWCTERAALGRSLRTTRSSQSTTS